jgi:RNA-directed DNA polymerase
MVNHDYLMDLLKRKVKGQYQLVVTKTKLVKLKLELKRITRKTAPMSFDERIQRTNWLIRGWINYFKYASMQEKLAQIDHWLRCRSRYCIWHHWRVLCVVQYPVLPLL